MSFIMLLIYCPLTGNIEICWDFICHILLYTRERINKNSKNDSNSQNCSSQILNPSNKDSKYVVYYWVVAFPIILKLDNWDKLSFSICNTRRFNLGLNKFIIRIAKVEILEKLDILKNRVFKEIWKLKNLPNVSDACAIHNFLKHILQLLGSKNYTKASWIV